MFNKKKGYFKKKLEGVEKMIWDFEFKRSKTRLIREDVRQAYDQGKSKLYLIEEKIKGEKEKPTMEAGDFARLEDEKVRLTRDIERYEQQMKALDLEVDGSKPTNEYPDGVQGITHQLDALQELKIMLADYIKTL